MLRHTVSLSFNFFFVSTKLIRLHLTYKLLSIASYYFLLNFIVNKILAILLAHKEPIFFFLQSLTFSQKLQNYTHGISVSLDLEIFDLVDSNDFC